jgi:hypothetical protein
MTSVARRIEEFETSGTTATKRGLEHVGSPARLGRYGLAHVLNAIEACQSEAIGLARSVHSELFDDPIET